MGFECNHRLPEKQQLLLQGFPSVCVHAPGERGVTPPCPTFSLADRRDGLPAIFLAGVCLLGLRHTPMVKALKEVAEGFLTAKRRYVYSPHRDYMVVSG